ncbi:phenylacetate-CoA oxygenase subunit PaaC [Natronosporangium hydrolyticum]|uniref:Phenylacetate-CoA oxygenase subunit PaaC n=1 Tax=Natronosporangium hydrolyticum TaxID=2811111 RepID=A0A895YJS4_9ACTN|nr:1,2-phenylacetyl-CoA epoxidase subunit PaaC [Natronosporangium hydrolyticum]QSB14360.1 phenylacetate-CoA oxygenase subunit PaaC [Natronosporangium hydrolyticum]
MSTPALRNGEVARFEEVLGLGDDALIAAQRLAEWCARAPDLEEDVALANIALDQLGAARLLLSYAGELEQAGRGEDELAYLRDDRQFRNVLLVELPNGDFATTMAKLLFLATAQRLRYRRLAAGSDQRLAGIAAKAVKESTYHLEHAALWTVRLGDGTDESHRRMQLAIDELWPYSYELCDDPAGGAGGELAWQEWSAVVTPVLREATLTVPADGGWAPRGGRVGRHTEHLSYLLAELQVLHRAHPGASW